MDEAILTNRLRDLVRNVNSIQMPCPGRPSESVAACPVPIERLGRNAQDLLDILGFSLKYLVFDLEATRRENAILRSIIARDDE